MVKYKTLADYSLKKGDVVIVRVDYNVPLNSSSDVLSDFRIRASLPTLDYLLDKQAKIVLISHLGRPKKWFDEHFSLFKVSRILSEIIKKPVTFVTDLEADTLKKAAEKLLPGTITMLENLRFYDQEQANDPTFAKQIIEIFKPKLFVQDGFGVIHRAHASTDSMPKLVDNCIGMLIEKELKYADMFKDNPKKPMMSIIGGVKISDKLKLIDELMEKSDVVVIGGAMANTFFAAEEYKIGNSIYAKEELEQARKIIKKAREIAKKRPFIFYLPEDVVVADSIEKPRHTRIVEFYGNFVSDVAVFPRHTKPSDLIVGRSEYILDIGPYSSGVINGMMKSMQSVFWNGSLGYVEKNDHHFSVPPFAHGSLALMDSIAENKLFSFVGGGDTVGFVENTHHENTFTHVSTGGGALLEYIRE